MSTEFATVGYRAHSQIHGEFSLTTEASRYTSAQLANLTAQGTIDTAVEAMKEGAYDYLTKPVDVQRLKLLLDKIVERLETSASGREVTRVVVQRNGAREEYSGSIVVSAAGAINSAALLLRSANEKNRYEIPGSVF